MRHWVLAEFPAPEPLLHAARALREAGQTRIDLHSPWELDGAAEALGLGESRLPWVGLLGGLGAAAGTYGLMWFANAVDYPLNVGGRPLHGWPALIPITFEAGVLGAGLALFVGLLAVTRLPRLHHPVFDADRFTSAAVDGFWLSLAVPGSKEDAEPWLGRLRELGATDVAVLEERTWN